MAKKKVAKKKIIRGFIPLKLPPFQRYRCNICLQEYDNETFSVDKEVDCPLCDNRDCAVKL